MTKMIKEATENNQFLLSLFNNMEVAVFLVDKTARIKNVNKSFTRLFYKSEEDVYDVLCGNAMGCIFPVRTKTDCGKTYHCKTCKLRSSIISCFEKKEDIKKFVIEREFFINDKIYLKYFHVTANYFEFKEKGYILIMIQDVSELESAKKELKKLNDLKNKFLGIAAHDLKNPISVISIASSYLLEDNESINSEKDKDMLEMIQRSSNYMLRLVNGLLDLSKIEAGKLILHKNKEDYIELVKEIIGLNKITASQRSINLKLEIQKKST
ncbi:MAG: PAS domain-containing protein [Promethearchaeota archaeon]|nr:MAG: PAS domain-containing protein [Candidatus Lokiarchaeota archaeon]